MADLSKLSTEELLKLAGEKPPEPAKNNAVDLSTMSDEELNQLAFSIDKPKEDKNIIQRVADSYDSYFAAPVRAAASELIRTDNEFAKEKPSFFGNLFNAGKAFANQFGEDPNLAPTGEQISEKRLGLSTQPIQQANTSFLAAKGGIAPEAATPESITKPTNASPASIVGAGLDVALDIGNVVPVGAVAKAGSQLINKGGKLILAGSKAALEATPIIGSAAKGTGKALQNAEKALNSFINPKRAPEFAELAEIAAKNGIDLTGAPEALEFGKNSFISRASRVQSEGPLGEKRLEDATKFFQDATAAFDRKLADASGGELLGRADAGMQLRDGFDNAVSNLFKENEVRYSEIAKQFPNQPIDQNKFNELNDYLGSLAQEAQKSVQRAFSPAQAQQAQMLLNKIDAIWKEGYTLDGAIDVLQNIGDVAFPKGGQGLVVGPDLRKTRDLYFKLRDTVIDSIESTIPDGKRLAADLRESNKNISQFMKTIEPLEAVLGNKNLAPEQVFDRLTKNTKQIKALSEILSPEDFQKVKGAYMDSLITRTPEGIINFGTLRNKLSSRSNDEVVKIFFPKEELAELTDIGRLVEAAGNPIMSTSGTGASNGLLGFVKDLPFRVAGESLIESQKARARGLTLPKEARPRNVTPRLGPAGIGAKEAIGLRLPQQISIQQRNEERRKGR